MVTIGVGDAVVVWVGGVVVDTITGMGSGRLPVTDTGTIVDAAADVDSATVGDL
jgi:hypothetical protein